MYADPQVLSINSVNTNFVRVPSSQPDRKGVFRTDDAVREFIVSQNQSSNRFRREVRLNHTKVAADPISAINKQISASIILVVDEPKFGYTNAELVIELTALLAWATTAANRDKLLVGEI